MKQNCEIFVPYLYIVYGTSPIQVTTSEAIHLVSIMSLRDLINVIQLAKSQVRNCTFRTLDLYICLLSHKLHLVSSLQTLKSYIKTKNEIKPK